MVRPESDVVALPATDTAHTSIVVQGEVGFYRDGAMAAAGAPAGGETGASISGARGSARGGGSGSCRHDLGGRGHASLFIAPVLAALAAGPAKVQVK